jgi:hypothetical protein
MYVTLRADQDGDIMPTLIVRQQPLTSKFFKGSIAHTNFLELPRWVISDKMIMHEYNIGTTNSTRCNFLQAYGQLYGQRTDPQSSLRQQILDGNWKLDRPDVVRSGSRPFILTSNADVQSKSSGAVSSIGQWAALLGDWYINMHLKHNGTVTMPGIVEPICVGDNAEMSGFVFHIESVTHVYECSEQGMKSFSTSLGLSNGVLTNGEYGVTRNHLHDETLMPGWSDEERYINDILIVSSNKGQS